MKTPIANVHRFSANCNTLQWPSLIAMSNAESDSTETPVGIYDFASAANAESGWMFLCPYGDFPHPMGLQRVTPESGRAMANALSGGIQRVLQAFGFGNAARPIFHGHPDDAGFSEQYSDMMPYGHITALESRSDGIWGKVQWADAANSLLSRGKFYFSPRWLMRQHGAHYEPTRLISVGLTTRPNIPLAGAANAQLFDMNMLQKILTALGYTEPQITALSNGTATDLSVDGVCAAITAQQLKITQLEAANATTEAANAQATTLAAANAALETRVKELTHKLATAEVETAIANGRIALASKEAEIVALANAADFDGAAAAIHSRARVLPAPQATDLGKRKPAASVTLAGSQEASGKLREAANAIVATSGVSYAHAWTMAEQANPEWVKAAYGN